MSKLPLTLACPPYDRVAALHDGTVGVEGIDLNFLPMEVEEIFWRQWRHAEFDCSELGLSPYVMAKSRGDNRFIAIPVFTSKFFRHGCIFINTGKGIKCPEDLNGKTIGVPEYSLSATVWIRGILQDEYGVSVRDISWCSGGLEEAGRTDKIPLALPPDIHHEAIPSHMTLSRMLAEGEIDALFTARAPSCFVRQSPAVARLFPNYREVEEDYYRRTGIFPIMHVVALRREFYEAHPWVAMSLFKAFSEAKEITIKNYNVTAALYATLPWLTNEVERVRAIMGSDWWPYGIEENRKTLETFLRYHHEQGLSARRMNVEELFTPETKEAFKI